MAYKRKKIFVEYERSLRKRREIKRCQKAVVEPEEEDGGTTGRNMVTIHYETW